MNKTNTENRYVRILSTGVHLEGILSVPDDAKGLVVFEWLDLQPFAQGLKRGLFGSSTGAAGALMTAAELPQKVAAIVSRGGRPDLAGSALPKVQAPTLLIVGGNDEEVIHLNEKALAQMQPGQEKKMMIVPGASHLFEEPGTLEYVARLATNWFQTHLSPVNVR